MFRVRLWMKETNEKIWRGWAWALPKPVAYWAAVRVMAYATGEDFPMSQPDRTSVTIALQRWQ